MLNDMLFACVILCILMLPMAIEDYRHRNVGLPLVIIFVAAAGILGYIDGAASLFGPIQLSLLFLSAFIAALLFLYYKLIELTDWLVVIVCILALGFIGAFAFYAAILFMVGKAIASGKLNRKGFRGLPFITIYLCSVIVILFLYLGVVALRI